MQYVPIGLAIGGVLLTELVLVYGAWQFAPGVEGNLAAPELRFEGAPNAESLGQVLYTDYILAFQLAGLILFVAMVGAIVLTLRKRPGVRKQNVAEQQRRRPEDVLEVQKVAPGTGV